jgi:FkbM family methyltransferase
MISLEDIKINLIDIGARDGIEQEWMKLHSYLKVFSFDPDVKSVINKTSNSIVYPYAIGAHNENKPFYICKDKYCSSLLKPNFDFLSEFPDWERFIIEKQINVKVRTLDDLLINNEIEQPDVIKIDAQGMSYDILVNSLSVVKNAICIVVECSYERMYVEENLIDKILRFMYANNFEIVDKKDFYWRKKRSYKFGSQTGNLIWSDVVFFKKLNYLTNNQEINSKYLMLKYYLISQIYDYHYESLDYIKDNKIINKNILSKYKLKNSYKNKIFNLSSCILSPLNLRLLRYIHRVIQKTILHKIGPVYLK